MNKLGTKKKSMSPLAVPSSRFLSKKLQLEDYLSNMQKDTDI